MFSSHAPFHLEAFSILFSENQSNRSWIEILQATKMIRVLTDAAEVVTFLGGGLQDPLTADTEANRCPFAELQNVGHV